VNAINDFFQIVNLPIDRLVIVVSDPMGSGPQGFGSAGKWICLIRQSRPNFSKGVFAVRIEIEIDDADLADWTSFEIAWAKKYILEGYDESGSRLSFEEWLGWDPSSDDDIDEKAYEILMEIESEIWDYFDSNMTELKPILEDDPSYVETCAEEIVYSIIDKISKHASDLLAESKAARKARA
jgi:hypothetical protein